VSAAPTFQSKLPSAGVSIFQVMSHLAVEHGAINIGQGFPDFDCDPALVDAVTRAMREGHNQYAPMPGILPLREALAKKIELLYGRRYDPVTEITVTSGATEGIYSTLTAFVRPGDEVVLFQPVYDSYVPAVQLSGGTPVFVTLRPPDYRVDWDEVRRAITPRTRAIMINTPHNPTGMVFDRADMRELAATLQGTDAIVIADEVYEHIVFDGFPHESVARYPAIADRAVVISSFGKTYHATGWKIGYCVAPEPLSTEVARVHQFVTYAVNGAIQRAYAEMVTNDPACASLASFYQEKRDLFLRLMDGSRFRPLACQGTFFQMMDYSAITGERDSEFVLRLIRERGVATIPLTPFLHGVDPGPVLRVCFAKRTETLERAAERLRTV
jgi:methionine aminotransferase